MNFILRARALPSTFGALVLMLALTAPATAQEEAAPVVLDQPIAQVNNDVIMLSDLRRAIQSIAEGMAQNEFKELMAARTANVTSAAEAESIVSSERQRLMPELMTKHLAKAEERKAEIIVGLINEELLLQRGQDIGLAEDIEAEVNREMLRVANQSGIKTIPELEEAMRREGLSPDEVRHSLRRGFMREAVFGREVDYKVYNAITRDEATKYHAANRDKFHSVTISEIFLSLAGRPAAEVQKTAAQLAAQARSGADFGALAEKHSEREVNGVRVAPKTKGRVEESDGKLRRLFLSELSAEVSKALKPLKAGGISDPVLLDDGYYIFKVHETDDAFNETHVRNVMTLERRQKEREAYVPRLRKEAYVEIAEEYKASVLPLLTKNDPAAPQKLESSEKPQEKQKP
ncbi:MAG TPA: peptidylprolyl isomerase [Pyrinomonadaceae bacterium]|nr:peptidylprolyl isomerase [Pyrinomonadaceae bacterium]